MLERLEGLSKNKLKIPLKKEVKLEDLNINRRGDGKELLAKSLEFTAGGVQIKPNNIMDKVLKHEYLRRSMEQRVERKALLKDFKINKQQIMREANRRETKTSKLRSQTVLDSIHKNSPTISSPHIYGSEF